MTTGPSSMTLLCLSSTLQPHWDSLLMLWGITLLLIDKRSLFVCFLTPPKPLTLMSWKLQGLFPLECRWFKAKIFRIGPIVCRNSQYIVVASCGYSLFSSDIGVNSVKGHYNFVVVQPLISTLRLKVLLEYLKIIS